MLTKFNKQLNTFVREKIIDFWGGVRTLFAGNKD